MARYSVNNYTVETLLSDIKSGNIAIPEMQRPFVWDSSKVRDLVDSLYKGFPVGYIIVWQNPDVKLKDGTKSIGKKVLIDGQQRITAMAAAIVGQEVLDEHYKWKRIAIAFNPLEEKFEVANNAILKSAKWIPDIAPVLEPAFDSFSFVLEYCQKNEIEDQMPQVNKIINHLRSIQNNSLGVITLDSRLDIDSVTDIFIRINSKGVVLSQADFAMSKISSNETYGGNITRKTIDYFCHLLESPEDLKDIKNNDRAFAALPEFDAIKWAASKNDPIYKTSYTDILRVAFTYKFKRGRLADLVSLLSGRDFETREFKVEIEEDSFAQLHEAVLQAVNQTNYERDEICQGVFLQSSVQFALTSSKKNAIIMSLSIMMLLFRRRGVKTWPIGIIPWMMGSFRLLIRNFLLTAFRKPLCTRSPKKPVLLRGQSTQDTRIKTRCLPVCFRIFLRRCRFSLLPSRKNTKKQSAARSRMISSAP